MNELLSAGVELMLVGMSIVFIFLALLVGTVNLMAWLVRRYFPEPLPAEPMLVKSARHDEVIAAISAAIHLHRTKD